MATHLFPNLAGGVRPFGCLQFICLPIYRFVCLPVWLVVSGFGCLQFMCLPLWQSICLPVWLVVFGSLRVSIPVWLVVSGLGYVQVICFPLVAIHLSPSLAGGVRLSACLDPTRLVVSGSSTVSNSFLFPNITIHLSPNLAGGVRLFACLQFMCLPLWQLICLPVWLVVSGSLVVSKSFVSPCGNSFVFDCGAVSSNSSCLPLVSEGWVPNCLPIAFQNSDLSPRIGLPIASKCLLFVALFFPSRLSRCCVPLVT